jgi:hypothetical protein
LADEQMTKIFFTTLFLVLFSGVQTQANALNLMPENKTLFDIINQSRNCETITSGLQCEYSAGDFFKISIAAIGTSRAGIHFEKSDSKKPIYASFGISHGCVIVNRFKGIAGSSEFVFVSPKNGVVYNSWVDCGAAF